MSNTTDTIQIHPEINWIQSLEYSHDIVSELNNFILKNMNGLLPLYGDELRSIKQYANDNNIPVYLMISQRYTLKVQLEINAFKNKNLSAIFRKIFIDFSKFDIGKDSIVTFLASTNFPINNVVKTISKTEKYKKLPVKKTQVINKILECNVKNNKIIKNRATLFETKLESYLKHCNIPFKTEHDIREEKIHTLTPDILFIEPIIITVNEIKHVIHWLDAKNYMLSNVPYMIDSLNKQALKYTNAFGKGGFVFHYGFDTSVVIDNTLILGGMTQLKEF